MKKTTLKLPVHRKLPTFLFCAAIFAILGVLAAEMANAAYPPNRLSNKTTAADNQFAKIRQIVQEYFSHTPHYQQGNLIVRDEAQKAMGLLQKGGFLAPNQQAILVKVLTKGDFLAQTLRGSRQGRAFMHQISGYPLAYDQLDRLRTQSVGRRTVVSLVRGPDGYKMLQYMNTSPQGKNLGRMLSNSKTGGGNYNQPTGRIYTAKQLIDAIEEQLAPKEKTRR